MTSGEVTSSCINTISFNKSTGCLLLSKIWVQCSCAPKILASHHDSAEKLSNNRPTEWLLLRNKSWVCPVCSQVSTTTGLTDLGFVQSATDLRYQVCKFVFSRPPDDKSWSGLFSPEMRVRSALTAFNTFQKGNHLSSLKLSLLQPER